jgi:hypothetical protein
MNREQIGIVGVIMAWASLLLVGVMCAAAVAFITEGACGVIAHWLMVIP